MRRWTSYVHQWTVSAGRRRGVATTPGPLPRWQFGRQREAGRPIGGNTHPRSAVRRSTGPGTRESPPAGERPEHGHSGKDSARSGCPYPGTPRGRNRPVRGSRPPSGRTKASRAAWVPGSKSSGYRKSLPRWRIPERQPAPSSAGARYSSQPPILGGYFHTGTTGTIPALGTIRIASRQLSDSDRAQTPAPREPAARERHTPSTQNRNGHETSARYLSDARPA